MLPNTIPIWGFSSKLMRTEIAACWEL